MTLIRKDAWEYNNESQLLQLKAVNVILMLKGGLLRDQNTLTMTMKNTLQNNYIS
jgi:hypothetical protein